MASSPAKCQISKLRNPAHNHFSKISLRLVNWNWNLSNLLNLAHTKLSRRFWNPAKLGNLLRGGHYWMDLGPDTITHTMSLTVALQAVRTDRAHEFDPKISQASFACWRIDFFCDLSFSWKPRWYNGITVMRVIFSIKQFNYLLPLEIVCLQRICWPTNDQKWSTLFYSNERRRW